MNVKSSFASAGLLLPFSKSNNRLSIILQQRSTIDFVIDYLPSTNNYLLSTYAPSGIVFMFCYSNTQRTWTLTDYQNQCLMHLMHR